MLDNSGDEIGVSAVVVGSWVEEGRNSDVLVAVGIVGLLAKIVGEGGASRCGGGHDGDEVESEEGERIPLGVGEVKHQEWR